MVMISPINITISSDSKTKNYDGRIFSASGHRITVGSLFEGHEYTATVNTVAVDPGEYENTIKNVKIIDTKTGKDVTHYYTITYNHGTLTIIDA